MQGSYRCWRMVWNVQRSPQQTCTDLHRLEAWKPSTHSHFARFSGSNLLLTSRFSKTTHLPNPFATKKSELWLTSPLTHNVHRAQLKLFGRALRATLSNLERKCVFTKAFVYRGGSVKSANRACPRRVHWAEQCAELVWHLLYHPTGPPSSTAVAVLQLHRLAVNRPFGTR